MCPKKFALALDGLQEALALECQFGSRKVVRLTFNVVYKIIQNTENSYIFFKYMYSGGCKSYNFKIWDNICNTSIRLQLNNKNIDLVLNFY